MSHLTYGNGYLQDHQELSEEDLGQFSVLSKDNRLQSDAGLRNQRTLCSEWHFHDTVWSLYGYGPSNSYWICIR